MDWDLPLSFLHLLAAAAVRTEKVTHTNTTLIFIDRRSQPGNATAHRGPCAALEMRDKCSCATAACVLLLVATVASDAKKDFPAGFASAQHAVIIAVDGVAIESLRIAMREGKTPNYQRLRAAGVHSEQMRSVTPTNSLPNWSALFLSARPAFSGINSNGWLPGQGDVVPPAHDSCATPPNIFSEVMKQRPNATTALYTSWAKLCRPLIGTPITDLVGCNKTTSKYECGSCKSCMPKEEAMVEAFTKALEREKFTLSLVYLDLLDVCAHDHGTVGAKAGYSDHISTVDGYIGKILAALERAGIAEDTYTAVVVATDHGRAYPLVDGHSHGYFSTDEVTVAWHMIGTVQDPVFVYVLL